MFILSSDDELVKKIAKGDQAAFKGLFDRHGGKVLGYAMRLMGGNRSNAEDIAQNAWMKMIESAPRYEPKGQFIAWIYTIVRNLTLNEFRKRNIEVFDESGVAGESSPEQDATQDAENLLMEHADREAFKHALDGLPDQQRVALTLWLGEEMSYEQIGEALKLSLSAVKSLLFRGRKNLEVALKRVEQVS